MDEQSERDEEAREVRSLRVHLDQALGTEGEGVAAAAAQREERREGEEEPPPDERGLVIAVLDTRQRGALRLGFGRMQLRLRVR